MSTHDPDQALLAEAGVNVRRSFSVTKHLEESWKDRCRVFLKKDQPKISFEKKTSICFKLGCCVCTTQDGKESLLLWESLKFFLKAKFSVNKSSPDDQKARRKLLDDQHIVLQFTAFATVEGSEDRE